RDITALCQALKAAGWGHARIAEATSQSVSQVSEILSGRQVMEAHAEVWPVEWPAAERSGQGAGALWSSRTRQQSGFLWSEPPCCRVRESQSGSGCGRVALRPTVRRIRSSQVLHNPHGLRPISSYLRGSGYTARVDGFGLR